ncbi:hypothetical protein CU002_2805 [Enterococcus faecium]|nr:hypothetical protein [Enterococcus faecium]
MNGLILVHPNSGSLILANQIVPILGQSYTFFSFFLTSFPVYSFFY